MNIFKYRILNHILFWIFIYCFYTLPFVLTSGDFSEATINLIYIPFDIIVVYFVIEFLIPRFLLKRKKIFIVLLGILFAISINIAITLYIKYNIQELLGFWAPERALAVDLFSGLVTNFMIVGLASAMKLLRYSYNIQLHQSELERRTVQSELNILRSQVNPHFLFNVLNNIDSLIFEDREKASKAIFLLSKIMRFMLKESSEEQVMLEKELDYITDYVELAKLGFENPEFIQLKINGSAPGKKIPPLLFIPVIENAVKHCNKQVEAPGIQIDFQIENESLSLKTSNYAKNAGMQVQEKGTGTGLKNVEKRLKLLYKENYTFDINRKGEKFELFLQIRLF